MAEFSLAELESALRAQLPPNFTGDFCIALSGGLDSTVLLHAVAQLRSTHHYRVRAVHVDHQLQAPSKAWAKHCMGLAHSLSVEVHVVPVIVPSAGEGVEAAARAVRYAALQEQLRAGEVLLTAHHADDQLETMLLALLRGAGARGLAAMPTRKAFGEGWHVRPLLAFTRSQLESWAREQHLTIVDDPSNRNIRFDRNYLRHEVLPQLCNRWPAAAHNATRAAGNLAEANSLLDKLAEDDWLQCRVGFSLGIESLKALAPERRRNLLRFWFNLRGLRMPSQRKLVSLERDLFAAAADSSPCVEWEGAEIHWHRGLAYADKARPEFAAHPIKWDREGPVVLPAGLGKLSLVPTTTTGLSLAKLSKPLTIKFRIGGERIQLPGRKHRHDLKKFLQSRGVLPWWRERLPLIYVDNELIAIADLAISEKFVERTGGPAVAVHWEASPGIFAAS